MAQTIEVQLVDDLDGRNANETVAFALDGTAYEMELSKRNAAALRRIMGPYIENARQAGSASRRRRGRGSSARRNGSGAKTLFSDLTAEEKARFRAWADMTTARRIADARVQSWIGAGRP